MSKFIWAGSSRNLDRFGWTEQGAVLELTARETAHVADDPLYVPLPTHQPRRNITGNTALSNADNGKRIVCCHAAPITITLPAEPELATFFEIYFGETGSGNVTIDPGVGKTIDSQSSFTLTAEADSVGLYWNNVEWKAL